MKKLSLNMLAIACLATTVVSCDRLGLNDAAMDSEEVATKVKETVTKNVDATQWKVYETNWSEGEKLGNKLGYISVSLVNKEGGYASQTFTLNEKHEFVADEIKESVIPSSARDKIAFDEVVGIDFNKLDGKLIVKQIEAAKALIPAEYEFKSVESYSIEEDVHRVGKIDQMIPKSDKEEKQYGKQATSMNLNVVKKGEGAKMEGRNITTNYYTISFVMKDDGSWEIKE